MKLKKKHAVALLPFLYSAAASASWKTFVVFCICGMVLLALFVAPGLALVAGMATNNANQNNACPSGGCLIEPAPTCIGPGCQSAPPRALAEIAEQVVSSSQVEEAPVDEKGTMEPVPRVERGQAKKAANGTGVLALGPWDALELWTKGAYKNSTSHRALQRSGRALPVLLRTLHNHDGEESTPERQQQWDALQRCMYRVAGSNRCSLQTVQELTASLRPQTSVFDIPVVRNMLRALGRENAKRAVSTSRPPTPRNNGVTFGEVDFHGGTGCPNFGSLTSSISPDGKSLSVIFSDFVVDLDGQLSGSSQGVCFYHIPVSIGPYATEVDFSADHRGFVDLSNLADLDFLTDYDISGHDADSYRHIILGPESRDFIRTDNVRLYFGSSTPDQLLVFNDGLLTTPDFDFSTMALDSTDYIIYSDAWRNGPVGMALTMAGTLVVLLIG